MKRKNLIARKKVKKNKLILKDPKILYFYTKFKSLVYKNIKNKNFALAVSGGSDSLCLAYFGKIYSSEFNSKVQVLIVDHKLRKESRKEALKVKYILSKKKIPSKILSWKGKIPIRNIQKNARDIRYSLISNFCLKKSIKYLMTAHHSDDQIENFFIRLSRGSGVTGLSSMSANVKYSSNLRIIRPFLNFKKKDLKHVTLKYFKNYIKDPSNENDKFLRIKIRKLNKIIEEKKLFNFEKIKKTIDNITSANSALSFYKNKAMVKYARFIPNFVEKNSGKYLVNKNLFLNEADEVVFKLFSDILSEVSQSYYPPRSKKVINLISKVKNNTHHKATLGGCVIECKSNYILISKEPMATKISNQLKK